MSSPEPRPSLSPFHRAFDRLYPAIRFTYERLLGHAWFSRIEPRLWLGGAPTYRRDYEAILALGITAVLDTRAERTSDGAFYDTHGITHRQFLVPDVTVPDEAVLTEAVAWIGDQLADGRTVLDPLREGEGSLRDGDRRLPDEDRRDEFRRGTRSAALEARAGQARGPAPPRAGVLGGHLSRASRSGVTGRRRPTARPQPTLRRHTHERTRTVTPQSRGESIDIAA